MTIDFYYMSASPPCRSVLMGAKAVGIQLNLKPINMMAGDHMKPEFLKLNPQHKIPTINDDGFALGESRSILGYLVDKYAKNDSLYPKDPKKRAVVNQRLYFDIGSLYQSFCDYYFPQIMAKASADPEKLKKMEEAFGVLEKILEGEEWVAGSNITIADISLAATVSTPVEFGFSLDKYPNISKWFQKCKKTIPSYDELNKEGLAQFKNYHDNAIKK